jgi:hypothetical protein
VTIVAGAQPALAVEKAANPSQLPEPGGIVTYQVKVRNTSPRGMAVQLLQMVDNLHGDVASGSNPNIGNSTCSLVTIQPGDTYQCTFEAEAIGRSGEDVTDTVTVVARNQAGEQVRASAQARVTIGAQAAPQLSIKKWANPTQLKEPGGTVTYHVRISNTGPQGMSLGLLQLTDDLYGDVTDGSNPKIRNSTCGLVTIQPGGAYECSFQAQITGNVGHRVVDTVTVVAWDPTGREVQARAKATVTIVSEPPDTGVPLPPPLIVGGLAGLGTIALGAGAWIHRRATHRS